MTRMGEAERGETSDRLVSFRVQDGREGGEHNRAMPGTNPQNSPHYSDIIGELAREMAASSFTFLRGQ